MDALAATRGPITADRTTPNLPSRDFRVSADFYARLGFEEAFREEGWMILRRALLELEFFLWPTLNPRTTIASCCVRVHDINALHAAFSAAALPETGIPRLTPPVNQPWGLRERIRLAAQADTVVVVRLSAHLETMENRIRTRETGMLQSFFVARVAELEAILDRAHLERTTISNDGRPITEVARELLTGAGWL